MKNDKRIISLLLEMRSKIDYVVSIDTIDSYTDRVIEEVIDKGKELEKLHNSNEIE